MVAQSDEFENIKVCEPSIERPDFQFNKPDEHRSATTKFLNWRTCFMAIGIIFFAHAIMCLPNSFAQHAASSKGRRGESPRQSQYSPSGSSCSSISMKQLASYCLVVNNEYHSFSSCDLLELCQPSAYSQFLAHVRRRLHCTELLSSIARSF